MIDSGKWEQMTDEQKLQMCKSVNECVSVRTISKEDWKLMFDFLLGKITHRDCAFCDKVQDKK